MTRASSTDGTVTKYFYNEGGNINYKVNSDGSKTVIVPNHGGKDIAMGTLRSIMKQAGLL